MSRQRFMGACESRVSGHRELLTPWKFDEALLPPVGTMYPLGFTTARMCELQWRLKKLSLGCGIVRVGDSPATSVTLERMNGAALAPITNERELEAPGNDGDSALTPLTAPVMYYGTRTVNGWNGDPDAIISVTAGVGIFFVGGPLFVAQTTDEIASSRCVLDTATGLWYPSISIAVDFFFSTPGSEILYQWQNFTDNLPDPISPDGAFDVDFLASLDGGVVGCSSYDPTSDGGAPACQVEAMEWWPYRREDGTLPVWDSGNGAQLLDPRQQPK